MKGDVEYIGDKVIAYISEEPDMPKIELNFNNFVGKDINLSYTLSYNVKYRYNGNEYSFTDFYEKKDIKVNDNKYTIQWDNVFQGGDLKIKWKIDNKEYEKNIMIRGKNPELSKVRQYGSTIGCDRYWFFWDIIGGESDYRQFMNMGEYKYIELKVYNSTTHKKEQKGLPLWGGPRGFGFAQLDNWGTKENPKYCNTLQRWNWKENLKGAIEVIDSKVYEVRNNRDLQKIVREINVKKDSISMDDLVFDKVTFTLGNSSIFPEFDINKPLPAGKRSIFDAHLIKYYNGGQLIKGIIEENNGSEEKKSIDNKKNVQYKIILDENITYLKDVYNNK